MDIVTGTDYWQSFGAGVSDNPDDITYVSSVSDRYAVEIQVTDDMNHTAGDAQWLRSNSTYAYLAFSADL
tara:strand:- start:499 stop:708 length:210 start_codon:yes stop_codon:yes gene_type:complete